MKEAIDPITIDPITIDPKFQADIQVGGILYNILSTA